MFLYALSHRFVFHSAAVSVNSLLQGDVTWFSIRLPVSVQFLLQKFSPAEDANL